MDSSHRNSSTNSPSRKSNSEDTQQSKKIVLFTFVVFYHVLTLFYAFFNLLIFQTDYTTFVLLRIIAFFLIPVLSYICYSYSGRDVSVPIKKEWKNIVTKLEPHLMEKRNKFPSQKEDLWFQISSGLKALTNDPENPAVYLLTYDENSMHPSSCIAEIITTAANK